MKGSRAFVACSADGSGEPEVLFPGYRFSISTDGRFLLFGRGSEDTELDLWFWSLEGSAEPEPFLVAEETQKSPALSPDGKWVAYASEESGEYEVYIKPFPSGPGKWQVSVDGGDMPSWSENGDRLYFSKNTMDAEGVWEVDVEAGASLKLSIPRVVLDFRAHDLQMFRGYEMFPGGEFLLTARAVRSGEEKNENAMPDGIFVVQNWLAEFK